MRKSTVAAAAFLMASSIGIGIAQAQADDADDGDGSGEHKVTLCHATHSFTNPYVEITVDFHSVTRGGHGGHEGPVFSPDLDRHMHWGDIIPAFDFGPDAQFGGLNLDAGEAILDNGCVLRGTTTTAPEPTTTTAPATTTTPVVETTTTTTVVPSTTTTVVPSTTTTVVPSTTTTFEPT